MSTARASSADTAPDDANAPDGDAPEEPRFTQADLDRIVAQRLAKEKRAAEAQRATYEAQIADHAEAMERLRALEEEKADRGRSEAERYEARLAAEMARKDAAIRDRETKIAEASAQATAAMEQLRRERVQREIVGELSKRNAINVASAARYALTDLADLEVDEQGRVTATYGDAIAAPLSACVEAWLQANDNFIPASGGGGTRSNGSRIPQADLVGMTDEQLLRADQAMRSGRGRAS